MVRAPLHYNPDTRFHTMVKKTQPASAPAPATAKRTYTKRSPEERLAAAQAEVAALTARVAVQSAKLTDAEQADLSARVSAFKTETVLEILAARETQAEG
jgi:hypothetical protein